MYLLTLLATAYSGRYAGLYAGSNGWGNYRHQADIFTIYTKLIENGWKTSEIKLMCYDDTARDQLNPFQGQIFHETSHTTNVYPGTEKVDVKGEDMTAQNFYKAISEAPTTTDDYVFIYYDNHGGPGILNTPILFSWISPEDLNAALTALQSKAKKILFGIEACYSGSVAQEFTAKNLGTITAANAEESSYAAVYDSQLGTYLTNEFTNYWIDEMFNNPTQTVGHLYETLKAQTQGSHVCWYGEEGVKDLKCELFWGKSNSNTRREPKNVDIVPQRVATLQYLEHVKLHGTPEERSKARSTLLQMHTRSEKLEIILDALIAQLKATDEVRKPTSEKLPKGYLNVLSEFFERFGTVNDDDLGRLMIVKNLCARYGSEAVRAAIKKVL